MVNIRQKGANGEREIYNALNPIVQEVLRELGRSEDEVLAAANCIQRNQNQSAVGGNDLSHTFGMSIEVKRQEALSINTWWKQCEEAAKRNDELPVLLYRQNGKKWKCVTMVYVELPHQKFVFIRAEFGWDEFLLWFREWVRSYLQNGGVIRK